jgi:CRP-like cAMP-binding protein
MVSLYELASPSLRYPECVHALLKEVSFGAGEVIHRAGECYKDRYLITELSLELRPKVDDDRAGAAVLGPGSAIGEMGFVNGFLATADVVAKTAVRALVIEGARLWRIQKMLRGLRLSSADFWGTRLRGRGKP